MSVFAGPNGITDGLILHLDASNPRSYPGTGTTWFDLTSGKNNGTLTNMNVPACYVKTYGGAALEFDGSNDIITVTSRCLQNLTSASVTIWVKSAPNQAGGGGLAEINQGYSNTHYPWYDGFAYINWLRYERVNNITLSSLIDRTVWHLVTATTQSGDKWRFYQNNIMISEVNAESTVNYNGRDIWLGGSGSSASPGYSYAGQIGEVRIYNRALSLQEIQYNFQAIRGRFNV